MLCRGSSLENGVTRMAAEPRDGQRRVLWRVRLLVQPRLKPRAPSDTQLHEPAFPRPCSGCSEPCFCHV